MIVFSFQVLPADAEPIEYEVQIIIEEFDTVDFQEESINAHFWVIITSDDVDFTKDTPILQFPNGIILDILQQSQYTNISPNKIVKMIEGEFDMTANFHNYPYEVIETSIILQIYDRDISEVVLKISPDQQEADIQTHGLIFIHSNAYVQTEEFYDGKIYSQLVIDTAWRHPAESIFLQKILPIIIIGVISVFILRVQPHNLENKAAAAVGLIFTLIAFQGLVVQDYLPQLEYLTFAEKLIIVDYAIIVFVLIEVLIQQRYSKGNEENAKKINNKMTALLPVVIVIVSVSMLFF
jgi:hypothetical protein